MGKKKDTSLSFAIVLREGDEMIGVTSTRNIDHRQGTAVGGILIGRKDLWGNGVGTEATMLSLYYAFTTLNLRKVCSSVYAFNERSIAYQKKCGFREEGRLIRQHRHEFDWVDEILLAVFAEDFQPLWEKFAKDLPE